MKFILFSVVGSSNQEVSHAEFVAECARAAQRAGFHAIAFSEHPAPSAKWLEHGGHESFDPYVALAYCAGVTDHLRLMPYLAVLPYRNPLMTAKMLASLDVLSQGRLTLVAGAGYLRSEFKALGVEFDERNQLLDEAFDVFDQVWTNPEFRYEGLHFTSLGQVSRPYPVQSPLPILIGGNSQKARERAVRSGSGWAPIQISPGSAETTRTSSLESLEEVYEAVASVRSLVTQSGRDNQDFIVQLDAKATDFVDNEQSMADRVDELRDLSNAGVDQCVVHIPSDSYSASLDLIRAIGRDLIKPFS